MNCLRNLITMQDTDNKPRQASQNTQANGSDGHPSEGIFTSFMVHLATQEIKLWYYTNKPVFTLQLTPPTPLTAT